MVIYHQKNAKVNQKQFKLNLSAIITRNLKTKSNEQLDTITNIKNLHESREEVIELYNDFASIKSEVMHRTNVVQDLKY